MKATVNFTTTASLSVDVEIDDDVEEGLRDDAAIEAAYEAMPGGICVRCSGWGHGWSRELSDEWEVATEGGVFWHDPDGRMAKIKRKDFPS